MDRDLCERSDGDGFSNGVGGDPDCEWSIGNVPRFDVVRHPGVAGRASARHDSCNAFSATKSTILNFTFDNHHVLSKETD